tara:strand:- start:284 stop:1015 length:732 start_codon:yes stop_codon:yes gene_type:complete
MNVLELFSGTGSIGKVCDKLGWNAISVDLELPATHECDIMNFDYKQYPKDYFSIVWASPPCTYYSNLQNCWIGRKKKDGIITTKEIIEENRIESDKLILKTLEIIDYFNPDVWFMENPQRGQLKDRDVVKDIPFHDVSYCMYSDWGYEKRTRIWTNKKDWNALVCDKSGACGNMIESQHKLVCDGGYDKRRKKHKLNVSKDVHTIGEKQVKKKTDVSINIGSGTNRLDRYRIPEDLIFSLFLD